MGPRYGPIRGLHRRLRKFSTASSTGGVRLFTLRPRSLTSVHRDVPVTTQPWAFWDLDEHAGAAGGYTRESRAVALPVTAGCDAEVRHEVACEVRLVGVAELGCDGGKRSRRNLVSTASGMTMPRASSATGWTILPTLRRVSS